MVLLQLKGMFMLCAVTGNHVEARDLCFHLRKEQESNVCTDINDYRHIVEREGHGRLL